MAPPHPVLQAVLLEQSVRESGVHSHGVSGGGQVVDDGVVMVLEAGDEAV
jgi:hypothetical protein